LQKAPAQFEEIAKAESACPSKAQGGKLQPFPKGKGMMVKEFEDAAAAIGTKGKIVGPVKTQFGYHLIRLDEAIPATTETFAKAKASIEAFLNGQAQQKAIQDYMAALLKANKVTFKVDMPKAM
jgi:parvulin-like peptidyl-prolyl isomerase